MSWTRALRVINFFMVVLLLLIIFFYVLLLKLQYICISSQYIYIYNFVLLEISIWNRKRKFYCRIFFWNIISTTLRASTSVRANFLSICQEKTYFFYFTLPLLQNTHISLSILHIYLIKYSFFLYFLLFPSISSLAQSHHLVFSVHTHTQPATLQQNSTIDSPIFHNNNHNNDDNNNDSSIIHNNKIRPLIHRSSTTTITTTTQSQSQQ